MKICQHSQEQSISRAASSWPQVWWTLAEGQFPDQKKSLSGSEQTAVLLRLPSAAIAAADETSGVARIIGSGSPMDCCILVNLLLQGGKAKQESKCVQMLCLKSRTDTEDCCIACRAISMCQILQMQQIESGCSLCPATNCL